MIWNLFALSGRLAWACAVGFATLMSWWYLSNYYIAPRWGGWGPWMDLWGFILVSAASTCVLGALARWRVVSTGFRPTAAGLRLSAPQWAGMLRVGVDHARAINAPGLERFLLWRLGHLRREPQTSILPTDAILSAWAGPPSLRRSTWRGAVWLPALWVVLFVLPYTGAMEFIADRMDPNPKTIFDVWNEYDDYVPHEYVGRRIQRRQEPLLWDTFKRCVLRRDSVRAGSGTLTVKATDFPRVYRKIRAVCEITALTCAFPGVRTETEADVVGGAAHIPFFQPPGALAMNMTVYLRARAGAELDDVCIEREGLN